MHSPQIVLASTSFIRKTLLANAGLTFTSQAPAVNEDTLKQKHINLAPGELALILAQEKALSLSNNHNLVIAADQTLSCDGAIFHKARTAQELTSQLAALKGKTHTLHTAVAVAKGGQVQWKLCREANLRMREFSDEFLARYIAENAQEALHCLGGYQLEAAGINLFEKIDGDYFTILGMPLLELLAYLRQENYLTS
jgi:septum formation protein